MTPALLRSVADLLDEADVTLAQVSTYRGEGGVTLTVTLAEAERIAGLTAAREVDVFRATRIPYTQWEGHLDGRPFVLRGDHGVTV